MLSLNKNRIALNQELTILGIALGLGLLVGLQKERGHSRIAGIRTFGLITIYGALSGLIANRLEEYWVLAAGIISVALLMLGANILKQKEENPDTGQTTEITALLMYGVGIYLAVGDLVIGVVVGAMVAILLYLKEFFSKRISQLEEKDIQAIMVFVAVSLVILPILPTERFGPKDVLSLHEIWLMVVLIVGISVAGYFAYKWLGKKAGTGLSGILGGLISSTATSVTFARQSKEMGTAFLLSGFVIVAASAVSFIRVIIEVLVVAPRIATTVLPPLLIVTGVLGVISIFLFFKSNEEEGEPTPDPKNPAQFQTALVFALLYAIILVLLVYAKDYFGSGGLYAVSILSGLTDMDAITLSLANTMDNGNIAPAIGWKYILVAGLANLVFKGGMVIVLGHKRLRKIIIPAFTATLVTGLIVLFIW